MALTKFNKESQAIICFRLISKACFFLCFSFCLSSNAKTPKNLEDHVNECLNSYKVDICKKALIKVNSYQVKAANRFDFPCQTRLLGLEANLIMVLEKKNRREKTLNVLKEIKHICEIL